MVLRVRALRVLRLDEFPGKFPASVQSIRAQDSAQLLSVQGRIPVGNRCRLGARPKVNDDAIETFSRMCAARPIRGHAFSAKLLGTSVAPLRQPCKQE